MKQDHITSVPRSPPLHATTGQQGPHVVVIGGGASGVLVASQLLRQDDSARVTIIEGHNMLGCGVAYSTTDPDHLLNTRVGNMSAFPDFPDHFRDWLQRRRRHDRFNADSFVSRVTYGEYMSDLLRPWSGIQQGRRLQCIRETCVRLEEPARGVVAHLSDGRLVAADVAILATGHALPETDPSDPLTGAWQGAGRPPATGRVVIIGSGLSMIDRAISLLRSEHRGEIVVVSRRAKLPQVHGAGKAITVPLADIPLGAPLSHLTAWVRYLARQAEADGGTWRDAVDGLRPHLRSIWRGLPPAERARFLRHAASWWEIHRHRLPPESAVPIQMALRTGRMRMVAGQFLHARRDTSHQVAAVIRPRGSQTPEEIAASRVMDCRGIRRDPVAHASPLVRDLLANEKARIDPLGLGLDVSAGSALLDAEGRASRRVFAIGPVSRSAFWEVTAIPDIRDQADGLARMIIAHHHQTSAPAVTAF